MSSDNAPDSTAIAETSPDAGTPVISVDGVGKCYRIYNQATDRLKQLVFAGKRDFYKPFWAIRNIKFNVGKGEAVGILGRNGSGKSTLLQVIAGTLAPTEGEVRVRGRVAALLELGSGFNPHFTGRENVFMAASILGIPKREMQERFDDVAAFADIGDFIDQPVSMYSNGMHARLAFSVAVAVQPDILILDEILAVGDMGFQQKCMARMRQMLDSGVTLLFVNHGPDAIKSLCQKGLLLVEGEPRYFGSAEEAVDRYLASLREGVNARAGRGLPQIQQGDADEADAAAAARLRYGTGHARIEGVRLLDTDGEPTAAIQLGAKQTIELTLRAHTDLERVDVAFLIRDRAGIDLLGGAATDAGPPPVESIKAGETATIRITFANNLRPGNYGVSLTLTRLAENPGEGGVTLDHMDACAAFQTLAKPGTRVRYKFHQPVEYEAR